MTVGVTGVTVGVIGVTGVRVILKILCNLMLNMCKVLVVATIVS